MKLRSIVSIILNLIRLMLSLLFLWLSFGWKVRKAFLAFEKELMKAGMVKETRKTRCLVFKTLKGRNANREILLRLALNLRKVRRYLRTTIGGKDHFEALALRKFYGFFSWKSYGVHTGFDG